MGGDIRAIGTDQFGRPWKVLAGDERGSNPDCLAQWDITDAGVATSSIARRKWAGGHHLIDPHTGRPSETDVLAATVVAGDALAAEVSAKTALLMGFADGADWLRDRSLTGVLTGRDGSVLLLP
ncbi:MAG: FAD:protein FMN transferase [Actinobacteria bacterium]|nr:FAD:protein FMN transferase [Actinomycetota bacterium]